MKDDDMVLVDGGQFLMGASSGDFALDSRPVHHVTLNAFYICRYPVTQKTWHELMNNNPSNKKGDLFPVEMVSWFDAIDFCNRLSHVYGFRCCYETINGQVQCLFDNNGFRLPTETEWEYAARGGNNGKAFVYSGSTDINEVAWYKNNSKGSSHNVETKKPNSIGLYDMSGNIWEWCWDWYGNYRIGRVLNPHGPTNGETKVYRGGSYIDFDYGCTVYIRGKRSPQFRQIDIGFRVARTADPTSFQYRGRSLTRCMDRTRA